MKQEPYEEINAPPHYSLFDGVEVIDVIEVLGMGVAFCWSNALKYLLRAGKKPGVPALKDVKKAQFYINRLVLLLEKSEEQPDGN